jgi:hypothetical protein
VAHDQNSFCHLLTPGTVCLRSFQFTNSVAYYHLLLGYLKTKRHDKLVALLLRIWEVPGSNVGPDTSHIKGICALPWSLQAKVAILP